LGVSHSPEELAHKLGRLAADYGDYPKSATSEAALIVKENVTKLAPARLRGVGKRGARLSVRYTVTGAGVEARARVSAEGPFQLIEADTQAHIIPKARTRGARRYVVIPNVGVRSLAHHPGTKGKHPWAKGVDISVPLVKRLYETKANLALRRIF